MFYFRTNVLFKTLISMLGKTSDFFGTQFPKNR
jgi:hypothetical protein